MTNDKLSLKEETFEEPEDTDTVFSGEGFDHLLFFSWYRLFSLLT